MACMGLDIGQQTATCAVPKDGGIEVTLNDYSQRQTPTMVSFGEKQRALGESAKMKAVTSYKKTLSFFKNLIGRKFSDAEVQAELANFHVPAVEMEDGTVGFKVVHNGEQRQLSVVQLLASLLGHLKTNVDQNINSKVVDCVVGVPVFFNDAQRHAFLDATRIANLNCLRLLNETSAVALAYGIYKQDLPAEEEPARRVIFVDFGHNSLQMSLTEFVKGKLNVLSTAAARVGGRNFDLKLRDEMSRHFKEQTKLDLTGCARPLLRLETECEKLKKQMSANAVELPINMECLHEDRDLRSSFTRDKFEELCSDVFDVIRTTVADFVASIKSQHGVTPADIFSVEVVGGSSRIPLFKQIFKDAFGKDVSTTLNSDEAVARGCALMAAIDSPTFRVRDFKVQDTTPYSITVSWAARSTEDDGVYEIFSENASSNKSKVLSFHRESDFELSASYTKPEVVPDNLSLIGDFKVLGAIPSFDGSAQQVKLKMKMDRNGCFQVSDAVMIEKLPPQGDAKAEEPKEDTMDTKEDAPEGADKTEASSASGDADEKEAEKKDPKQKKPKTHKNTPLKIETHKPYVLTAAQLNALVETELEMKLVDTREKEKNDARNALEEYIYDIREKIGSILEDYIKPEDSDTFRSKLTEMEDWLYDEGEDQPKKVYVEKLDELKTTGSAVKTRAQEAEERPQAIEALRTQLVRVNKFVSEWQAGNEAYAHISQEDVDKVKAEASKQEAFINEKEAAQAKLKKYEDVAVTVAAVKAAGLMLDTVARPIMNKPKPKVEPPKEEPAPETPADDQAEAQPEADKPKDASEGKHMDLD